MAQWLTRKRDNTIVRTGDFLSHRNGTVMRFIAMNWNNTRVNVQVGEHRFDVSPDELDCVWVWHDSIKDKLIDAEKRKQPTTLQITNKVLDKYLH